MIVGRGYSARMVDWDAVDNFLFCSEREAVEAAAVAVKTPVAPETTAPGCAVVVVVQMDLIVRSSAVAGTAAVGVGHLAVGIKID